MPYSVSSSFYSICKGIRLYIVFFYPITEETAELGKYRYYVVSSVDWDGHGFETFYKCRKIGYNCDNLYGGYSLMWQKIIVDGNKNEVSLLGHSGLIYTDGEVPRAYAQGAAVVQLGNFIYLLSEKCNNFNHEKGYWSCETYTYRLYECDLDYKSCNPLAIQYTDKYILYPVLEGNEELSEIELYNDYKEDGGTLIFTYGEHPRCYVEGCVIMQP